jgi:ornithine carbamoyltransferase
MTRPRHFLSIDDLAPDELTHVLGLARRDELPPVLAGKGAALLFEKPTLRTRHSMEMAVFQLGGHPITDSAELDKREKVEDLTQVLAGYHALIAARVFKQAMVERMAAVSDVPVINMLSDFEHPLQALADLLTLRQEFGSIEGRRIVWFGEFNNVARSLARGARRLGADLVSCGPEGFGPAPDDKIEQFRDPVKAAEGADVVVTDTWYSMGWEKEADERRPQFRPYCVTADLMAVAASDAILLHCLPAHRGEEATDEVLDSKQSRIFPEAHNRMHTARALIAFLFGVR